MLIDDLITSAHKYIKGVCDLIKLIRKCETLFRKREMLFYEALKTIPTY